MNNRERIELLLSVIEGTIEPETALQIIDDDTENMKKH